LAKDYSAIADAGNGWTNAVILEFNINEGETGRHLIFALGPTLASEGVSNVAADPILILEKDGLQIDQVDNWRKHPSADAVEAFTKRDGRLPADVEAALIRDLTPGVYTIVVENNVEDTFGKVRAGITKDTTNAGDPTGGDPRAITPGLWSGKAADGSFEGCLNISSDGKKITKIGSTCVGKGQREVDGINIQIDEWDDDDCGDDSGYIDWNQDVTINNGRFDITDNSSRPWFPLTIEVTGFFFEGRVEGTLIKTIYGDSCRGSFTLTPAGSQ
jgi:hypothetical protein